MRIIAFGDIHMDTGSIGKIPGLEAADLVILTGDLTNFGGVEDARSVVSEIYERNKRLLALPGNLDQPQVLSFLQDSGLSLHGTGTVIDNIGIFGAGGSNKTPFGTPFELEEQEIGRLIEAGHSQVAGAKTLILVSHAPPLNTRTDITGSGSHVGSSAVRAFIEKIQPAICITGHIHESRGEDRISGTRIVNPGMLSHGGWVEITIPATGEAELILH